MEYSICIRTLGNAGEKYSALLKSIKKLSLKPKEIIITIPYGYKLPNEEIENQRFLFCEKGMLRQRIAGYKAAETEYVLLLDDDLEFEEKMIEKLSKPVLERRSDISFPIYEELLPEKGIREFIAIMTLSAIPRRKDDNYFVKIIGSGGYSYSRKKVSEELYSESAPGMCIFARREALIKSNLEEELWVEKPGYALRDDTVMIYKPHLKGYRTIGVWSIVIKHLDAGSNERGRKFKAAYASSFNQVIFWHKFILKNRNTLGSKIRAVVGLYHWIISSNLYLLLRDIDILKNSLKGIRDAFYHIKELKNQNG